MERDVGTGDGNILAPPRSIVASSTTIDLARAGDTAAVSQLWTIYQPQLLRLLRARGMYAAEDVASQVWLLVARGLSGFEGDGEAFRRWIFTIAGRRAVDEHRRSRRQGDVSSALQCAEPPQPPAEPCARLDAADAEDRTVALLRELTPAAAEVVMLRVIYEMSVSEVAEITGRTEASVRVLVHRGLGRLRILLAQHYAAESKGRQDGGTSGRDRDELVATA